MKNNYITAAFALFFLTGTAGFTQAQIETFEKIYGGPKGDFGRAMAVTADSGFIIAGQTSQLDSLGDTYLMKTDKNGLMQWQRIIGGNKLEGGNSVVQTSDRGYLVTNHTESYGAGDCDSWLVKTDENGIILWNVTYGGTGDDVGEQGIETADGDYIAVGVERSLDPSGNAFLVKYDGSGNLLWSKTYGGTDVDAGVRIVQTPDNGYVVAGETTTNSNGLRDILVFKTDAAGTIDWLKNFGGAGDEEAFGLTASDDGGFVITGYSTSFGNGDADIYLLKVDDTGNLLWSKNYGGMCDDVANSVVAASDGGFMMTGYTKSFGDSLDAFIIKTDEFGNQLWMKTYGDNNSQKECKWIVACPGGGYAMTGSVTAVATTYNPQLYLLKTDDEGNVTSNIAETPFSPYHAVVYPDPAKTTINLSYDNIMTNPVIQIYNSLGAKVYEGQNQKNIDISSLPQGMYYLTLKHEAQFFSQKFIHE